MRAFLIASLKLGFLPVNSSSVVSICKLTVTSGVASTTFRTAGLLLLYAKLRSIWLTWKKSLALFSSKIGTLSFCWYNMSKSASLSVAMALLVGPGTNGVLSYAFL